MKEPRVVDLKWHPPDSLVLTEVARHLKQKGLVAMPTETVYGFSCIPDDSPVEALRRLKARGPEKPFLLLIPNPDAVPELDWTGEARELAGVFWPGALTLVLRDPTGRFPLGIRSPGGGVAIRVSPHPLTRAVIGVLKCPLVSTSANSPGGLPALTAEDALVAAREIGAGETLWVLDGGPLRPSDPSTIIDCTGARPEIRRVGAIPLHRLRCVLPEIHEAN